MKVSENAQLNSMWICPICGKDTKSPTVAVTNAGIFNTDKVETFIHIDCISLQYREHGNVGYLSMMFQRKQLDIPVEKTDL